MAIEYQKYERHEAGCKRTLADALAPTYARGYADGYRTAKAEVIIEALKHPERCEKGRCILCLVRD
jgi:hypothetical protein